MPLDGTLLSWQQYTSALQLPAPIDKALKLQKRSPRLMGRMPSPWPLVWQHCCWGLSLGQMLPVLEPPWLPLLSPPDGEVEGGE